MKKLIYISLIFLLAGITFAQKDILVNWECNMEIELLSGRYITADTVAARGSFNGWDRHDMAVSIDPNIYVSAIPDTILQASVGDTIITGYKFYYTTNNTYEAGDNKIYILTQDDYDNGEATVSRAFNDATLTTVTNQPTDVLFKVDCNGAISILLLKSTRTGSTPPTCPRKTRPSRSLLPPACIGDSPIGRRN